MSGGFFRGTSADQDTRFSNKQAKLLKSQKFPPELENLVDMTKVKMDVMKPWIAKRVTELIGFEDEVLINFIYGLLEGEAVNGKQVQISLTGFMERNTGKFMKELWLLLLSAQQNMSGVPQQFLDAKEEETQKKKAETDRIANEIQRKKEKEKQEFQEEKAKMDGDGAKSRDKSEPNVKHDARNSSIRQEDEKERYKRNGRGRSSRGSQSPDSPSARRKQSVSPSKYESRSYSERRRLRSISAAPVSRSRSISSERRDRSPPRRSMTPRRRRSPSPRRRSHVRRRSRSPSRRRSPSPERYSVHSPRRHRSRSPLRRRSRSPVRRRSRSPIWRSPVQYRSRMPSRRRSPSPMKSRSPSPIRGKSPSFERRRLPSPVRRRLRSPVQHRRSPSPVRHHSPSSVRRRSPTPVRRSRSPLWRRSPSPRNQSPSSARRRYRRSLSTSSGRSISPTRRRSSVHGRKRSISPVSRRSPSPQASSPPSRIHRSSLSPARGRSVKRVRSPIQSPGERTRRHGNYSPARRASPSGRAVTHSGSRKGIRSAEHRPVISLRSPQRDVLDQRDKRGNPRNMSPSTEKSPSGSDASKGRSYSEERRSVSPHGSPHQRRGRMVPPESPNPSRKDDDPKIRPDISGTSLDDENKLSSRRTAGYTNKSSGKSPSMPLRDKDSVDTDDVHRLAADGTKLRESQLTYSDRSRDSKDHKEHRERKESSKDHITSITKTADVSVKNREYDDAPRANKDKNIVRAEDGVGGHQFPDTENLPKLSRKQKDHNGLLNSPLKETDEHGSKIKEKRKHKKSDRQDAESDDISSGDSYGERKEAKKRRKEEKKLKKETRRRRRDEKRRRKDERRAEKLKLKSGDANSSSSDLDHSEEESAKRRESRASDIEETMSEQKRLEMELREKALKSLRAKKGLGN